VSYTDDDYRRRRRDDDDYRDRRRDDDEDRPRRRRRDDDDDDDYDYRPRRTVDIPNYLVQAILCTLFCCLPAGVVAIVYAAQVNGKLESGDIRGARDASDAARTWCWLSFGGALAVGVAYFLFILVFAGLAANLK
jgi:hypothetical protein